jgi:oligosaccharide repeat unit polymerase
MTIAGTLLLTVLWWLNLRVGGSLMYPPAVFALIWATLLAGLSVSGDTFYQLSPGAVGVYIVGAIAFSAGGFGAWTRRARWHKTTGTIAPNPIGTRQELILNVLLAGVAACAPLYIFSLIQSSPVSILDPAFFLGIRQKGVNTESRNEFFGLFAYVIALASLLAPICLYESKGSRLRKVRAVAAITLAYMYQLGTASRLGALMLSVALVSTALFRRRKIALAPIVTGGAAVTLVFFAMSVMLNKGGRPDQSAGENVDGATRSFQLYAFGGLVAFDNAMQEPEGQIVRWRSVRFPLAVANAFDKSVQVPEMVLGNTPTPTLSNVYTMYYTYFFDYGPLGVLFIMSCWGAIATTIYHEACRNRPAFVILIAYCNAYMALSMSDEYLLTGLSTTIQVLLVLYAIYGSSTPKTAKRPGMSVDLRTTRVLTHERC